MGEIQGGMVGDRDLGLLVATRVAGEVATPLDRRRLGHLGHLVRVRVRVRARVRVRLGLGLGLGLDLDILVTWPSMSRTRQTL